MSAAAIRLRERLIELRDEQDAASPEFARLDRVATLLESARIAAGVSAKLRADLRRTYLAGDAAEAVREDRARLARRIREARAALRH